MFCEAEPEWQGASELQLVGDADERVAARLHVGRMRSRAGWAASACARPRCSSRAARSACSSRRAAAV